jgi:carbon-monoxide dehydrogenase large subunit/6-hydroxypseudooxynicotine dehydrogenase subunit gamma
MMTGSATYDAALKVRAKAIEAAATLLQVPTAGPLEIVDGQIAMADDPGGPSVGLADVAKSLSPGATLSQGRNPGLSAEGSFYSDLSETFPYGMHVVVVKVDRETGAVKVERYLAAYDIGRAINPMLVEGQIVGSVAQGLGGALLEEFVYADNGAPLSVTFADYLMPTAHEVPEIEVLLTEDAPSPRNPLGIKGGGESGTTGAGAAVASAIDDALGVSGAITQLPITPPRLKQVLDRAIS